ncbi:uncharacterized protein LOC135931639 [Gordionus sp. m RMFG-2023]|uniref:uncharacterized protein LOC135924588 n=1 Tax=Gordionus sp. m RMFG-2023 TaxID=3053472 RepID=UPI0031FE283E
MFNIESLLSNSNTNFSNLNENSQSSSRIQRPKRIHKYWNKEKLDIVTKMLSMPEKQQMKIKDIAKYVEMSTASVHKFRRDTFPEINGDPLKEYNIQKRGSKKKDSSIIERSIISLLMDNNTLTIQEIIEKLPPGSPKTKTTISKYIKNIGWSKKRAGKEPDRRNTPGAINIRQIYCAKILNIPRENLYFLDETGINLHVVPIYAWAPYNVRPIIKIPSSKGKNVSILCTIGIGGVIHYKIIDGAYNGLLFRDSMTELISILPPDAIIVMDNASIHRSHLIDSYKGRIEYLPPYSPQLNPIENFFGVLKNKFRAINPRPNSRDEIVRNIIQLLHGFIPYDFTNFYNHMQSYLELGYRGQLIN